MNEIVFSVKVIMKNFQSSRCIEIVKYLKCTTQTMIRAIIFGVVAIVGFVGLIYAGLWIMSKTQGIFT